MVAAWLDPVEGVERVRTNTKRTAHQQQQEEEGQGDYLTIRTTYGTARDLLGSQFHVYEHRSTGATVVRTTQVSLPRQVADHIDVVYPATNFGTLKPARVTHHGITFDEDQEQEQAAPSRGGGGGARVAAALDPVGQEAGPALAAAAASKNGSGSGAPSQCSTRTTTLPCIQALYNVPNATLQAQNGASRLAIAGFLEEYPNYEDFDTFKKRYTPYASEYAYKIQTLNGGKNNQSLAAAGVEANLDVQAAMLAFPLPTTYFSVGGRGSWIRQPDTPTNTNEDYHAIMEHLLTLDDDELFQVTSYSYDDNEASVSPASAHRICEDIMLLGIRGSTQVFASGGTYNSLLALPFLVALLRYSSGTPVLELTAETLTSLPCFQIMVLETMEPVRPTANPGSSPNSLVLGTSLLPSFSPWGFPHPHPPTCHHLSVLIPPSTFFFLLARTLCPSERPKITVRPNKP